MKQSPKKRLAERESREKLAQWMIGHSFATGHGDSLEDLLKELSWQIEELRHKLRSYSIK